MRERARETERAREMTQVNDLKSKGIKRYEENPNHTMAWLDFAWLCISDIEMSGKKIFKCK